MQSGGDDFVRVMKEENNNRAIVGNNANEGKLLGIAEKGVGSTTNTDDKGTTMKVREATCTSKSSCGDPDADDVDDDHTTNKTKKDVNDDVVGVGASTSTSTTGRLSKTSQTTTSSSSIASMPVPMTKQKLPPFSAPARATATSSSSSTTTTLCATSGSTTAKSSSVNHQARSSSSFDDFRRNLLLKMQYRRSPNNSNRSKFHVSPQEIFEQPVTTFFVMEVDSTKLTTVFAKTMSRYLTEGGQQNGCVSVTCFLPRKANDEDMKKKRSNNRDSSSSKKQKTSTETGDTASSSPPQDRSPPPQDGSDESSAIGDTGPRFVTLLIRARYASFTHFTKAISASYSAPAMDHLLREDLIRKFPIMTMWHKVNPIYEAKFAQADEELHRCSSSNSSTSSPKKRVMSPADSAMRARFETLKKITRKASASSVRLPGRSTYFMMRTRKVKRYSDKEFVVEILCRLASQALNSSSSSSSGLGFVDNGCGGGGGGGGYHPSSSNNTTNKNTTDAVSISPTTYDVLVSNDMMDRHNEIMEWASWTSYEAYELYLKQDFVQYYEQVASSLCVASSTTTTTSSSSTSNTTTKNTAATNNTTTAAEEEQPHPLHHAWKIEGATTTATHLKEGTTETPTITTSFWKRAPAIKPDLSQLRSPCYKRM